MLIKHLTNNNYYYEDLNNWYFKKIGTNDISVMITDDLISVHAYKGKEFRHLLCSSQMVDKDEEEFINLIKGMEEWISK